MTHFIVVIVDVSVPVKHAAGTCGLSCVLFPYFGLKRVKSFLVAQCVDFQWTIERQACAVEIVEIW